VTQRPGYGILEKTGIVYAQVPDVSDAGHGFLERVALMSSDADASNEKAKERAKTYFQYGNDAALKNNHDYAVNMYQSACKIDPGNLIYRQALRGIERRKFGNDPAKVGKLVGMKTNPIRLKAKAPKAKGNWKGVLETCEEVFVLNPWDIGAARDAAEASQQLGFMPLAQWLLESVSQQATDAEFFRHLARVEEESAAWQKAIQAWERVKKIDPNDEEAGRKINALSANATIQRAGLTDAIDKRNEQTTAAPAEPTEAELEALALAKLSPEERLMKEIQDHPEHVGPFLELSDIHKGRNQLEEAEKVLARGLKAHPEDETLRLNYAEVQLSRLQHAVEVFTKRSSEKPQDEAIKAKLNQYKTMLMEYEIKEYGRRAKLHPDDLGVQLQLGKSLARAGKNQEAIAAFQHARNHPTNRVEALHQLGLCFEAIGNLKLAERNYQDALKAADPSDLTRFNALHYQLGRVAESQGNNQAAEEHYNEVAANDYSYRDVAERLKNLSSA
jgi:tetratricopeptide (TPR) repeat protein